jgi:hypothetical protein
MYYPSNAEMINSQLTNLIEFRSLQPEPLIQLFNEDFVLKEYIESFSGEKSEDDSLLS